MYTLFLGCDLFCWRPGEGIEWLHARAMIHGSPLYRTSLMGSSVSAHSVGAKLIYRSSAVAMPFGVLSKACDWCCCCSHTETQPGLQIVAASALVAGQEIHNTYGEYGNSELVYKYGFALRHNPFDSVSVDKSLLLDTVKSRLQPEAFDARCSFLNELR